MKRRATPAKPRPASPAPLPGWTTWAALTLVVIATALAYASSVHDGFTFDDRNFVFAQGSFSAELLGRLFRQNAWGSGGAEGFSYRPLAMLTIHLDGHLWGRHGTGYHVTSLVLHVGTTAIVFGFLHRVLRDLGVRAKPGSGGFDHRAALAGATAGALIFGLHPIHTEAVDSFFNRSEVMVTAAATAAIWLVWVWRSRRPIATWIGAALLYFAALLCKESAVTLPGLIVIVVGLVQLEGPLRARVRPLVPVLWLAIPLAVYFALRVPAIAHQPPHGAGTQWRPIDDSLAFRVQVMLTTIADAVRMLVWPHPLRAAHDKWTLRMPVVLALAMHAGLGWLAIRSFRRGAAVLPACVAFFYLAYVPASLATFSAERFVYLPSVGLALALAVAIGRFWGAHRQAVMGAVVVASGMGAVLTSARAADWRSDEALFRAETRAAPDSPEAAAQLVSELIKARRHAEAETVCEATMRRAESANLDHLCGGTAQELGDGTVAARRYQRAIDLGAGPAARANLARLLLNAGRPEEASLQYRLAIDEERNPLRRRYLEADRRFRVDRDPEGALRDLDAILREDPVYEAAAQMRQRLLAARTATKKP